MNGDLSLIFCSCNREILIHANIPFPPSPEFLISDLQKVCEGLPAFSGGPLRLSIGIKQICLGAGFALCFKVVPQEKSISAAGPCKNNLSYQSCFSQQAKGVLMLL